jgi:phosphinothricin acetyltransferase
MRAPAIRDATESDLPAIAAIYDEAVLTRTASYEIDPPGVEEMTRRFRDLNSKGFPYLVAVSDGLLAGYAYAGPYRLRPAYRFTVEDSIYIAPGAQRSGIGRALLGELIAQCEAGNFRQMIAVIGGGTENPASVRLHEKMGFRLIGVIEGTGFKHGRWLDTVLMQRPLGPGNAVPPEKG